MTASVALFANADAALIAGFDFQTTATGGTAAVAAPSPLVYTANFGTATLYLDGSNGSSTFTSATTNPQVTAFAGTNINTSGTSFDTTNGVTLTLANQTSNGFRAVFAISMAGFQDLVISYATQATASGFDLQTWSYSTNGTTFTDFDTFDPKLGGTTATTFAGVGAVTLDTLTAVNDVSTVYIGLTITGATSATGNNRLDNIQFNATAIPEPATALLGAVGLLGILRRRR